MGRGRGGGGEGWVGEGGGGTGDINNTCLDYIQCEHNCSYYILDSIIDFNSLRYECCLGLSLLPGAEFHASGNEHRGSLLTISTRCGGIYKSFALRRARSGFLSIFDIQVFANERGNLLKWKLCINLILAYSISFSRGKTFNFLN